MIFKFRSNSSNNDNSTFDKSLTCSMEGTKYIHVALLIYTLLMYNAIIM